MKQHCQQKYQDSLAAGIGGKPHYRGINMKMSLPWLMVLALSLLLQQGVIIAFQRPSLQNPARARARLLMAQSPVENKPPEQLFKAPSATEEVQNEAREALKSVGWAMPAEGDLTSEDPFVKAIDLGIQNDMGVSLNDLLNPAKVVNLERDLYVLRTELARVTGAILSTPDTDGSALELTTAACDLGGGGEAADELRAKIQKKEQDLAMERRSVFRGWLKNIFLGQAILRYARLFAAGVLLISQHRRSFALSFVMATNPRSLFGGFDWYYSYNMDVSISVLGYWWWWLFVVPSLRSRRPTGLEKKALDIAFVATPAVSVLAPIVTKDTGVIWAANLAVVVAAYGYAFLLAGNDSDKVDSGVSETTASSEQQQPAWLKFVFKSLDFGSGKERGVRK
jgi:hypothetical protein